MVSVEDKTMDSKDNGTFWPSYVDIMTTLFAIMLVLFAVSFSRFKVKEMQLQSLVAEYKNIITVYSTVSKIDSTKYFGYNEEYLKHLFTVDVRYQSKEFDIQSKLLYDGIDVDKADAIRDSVIEAGKLIKKTLAKLERPNADKSNIKFLVIIEGQSSKVKYDESPWKNNYTLSYKRAQNLYDFWKENGIELESSQCQVIISGSGEEGVPRFVPDTNNLKAQYPNPKDFWRAWINIEEKNQRFLIHIVPVIGNIDVTLDKFNEVKNKANNKTTQE